MEEDDIVGPEEGDKFLALKRRQGSRRRRREYRGKVLEEGCGFLTRFCPPVLGVWTFKWIFWDARARPSSLVGQALRVLVGPRLGFG